MKKKIAILGGGISGVTAAYRLQQLGADFTLLEASGRLGGIVETHRQAGFVIECGPDSWVTDKPWARDLAVELGLKDEIVPSNDHQRRTYILLDGALIPMPEHMRMMVPQGDAGMDALLASPLFSESAKRAYLAEPSRAEELKAWAASHEDEDESVATFVQRHFGEEVAHKLAAPLLSGVFGGSIHLLSVRAVMAPFVALERQYGSLVTGLRERTRVSAPGSLFTSLSSGLESLIEGMTAILPTERIEFHQPVHTISRQPKGWSVTTSTGQRYFDHLILATPPDVTQRLLQPIDSSAAELLPAHASSAIIVALAFTKDFPLPHGFGFLVPQQEKDSRLLAATFVDQKFTQRAPAGQRVLRAFFADEDLLDLPDSVLVRLALNELARALSQELPEPVISLVRRWPRSLPQYEVGHLERMQALAKRMEGLSGLQLIGNAFYGVGLPDLVRQAEEAAQRAASI